MISSEADSNRFKVVVMQEYSSPCGDERYLGLPFVNCGLIL